MGVNITFTSTPDAARAFYKKDLMNGFFGRIPFAYIPRGERVGRIPRQGNYSKGFLQELECNLVRLDDRHFPPPYLCDVNDEGQRLTEPLTALRLGKSTLLTRKNNFPNRAFMMNHKRFAQMKRM